MRLLFYLGHPAHYHLFKHVIANLKAKGHDVEIAIKAKDVLKDLLQLDGCTYHEVKEKGPKKNKIDFALNLLVRDLEVFKIARSFKPHIMIGTSAEITHVGKLLNIQSLVVNEDDIEVVPWFARLAYPFASSIIAPVVCSVGKWKKKTITYEGYHELAYLHPNHFTPDPQILEVLAPNRERYFIVRFAQLTAHHDVGRKGISVEVANHVIDRLSQRGTIYISSERPLEESFEKYRISINPDQMHSALYYADLYLGDSQTMAAEAAVLGTPSIRYNDFVGEISYLDELEHRFGLTCGIRTAYPERLLQKIDDWMSQPGLAEEWHRRRNGLLEEKIDVAQFMSDTIESIQHISTTQLIASGIDHAPPSSRSV